MWQILGTYQGQTEVIDETDTLNDARYLVSEYRLAYGSGWFIRLRRVC